MKHSVNRRDFIRKSALAGVGLSVFPFHILEGKDDRIVNIGLVGVGSRGQTHLRTLLRRDDVKVTAISDIDNGMIEQTLKIFRDAGADEPYVYADDEFGYEKLNERDDVDGVVISTPWRWHEAQAVDAMKKGKTVGLEIPAALTVEGCWNLVRTSEETGVPCMLLENVCYRRDVMAILKMVREGLFGETIHARCGYRHSLFDFMLDEDKNFGPGTGPVSSWRMDHYVKRDGDLYPNHGIGPVAHWLDIDRGNRFMTISSTSTKARGINEHVKSRMGADHPNTTKNFKCGDIVTSTLTTARGESVIVTHDTTLPRPYSLDFQLQGTKGIWLNDNRSIHIDLESPDHQWEKFEDYRKRFDSNLWQLYEQEALGAGHGGIDFFVMNGMIEAMKNQAPVPIDVYDAATWSVISPLSEKSITQGGQPIRFPDFTRGNWMSNKPVFKPETIGY